MTASGPGEFYQQIGEILATVRQLDRQQVETTHTMDHVVERLHQDVDVMKRDTRNAQEVALQKLEAVTNEQLLLKQRLAALEEIVDELKKPVEEMAHLRVRLGAIGVLAIGLGTFIWAVLSPLWTTFASRLFGVTH